MQLEINNVSICLGTQCIVNNLNLHLKKGEICGLIGPSGCGKTTLLRAIAGFIGIQKGDILLHHKTVSRPGWQLPPEQRHVGLVFQDYALFPHLNVMQNICFGIRHWHKQQTQNRLNELLNLVDMQAYATHYPHQLSGGQQQRIALVRAMAPRPNLLLLDEPFGSQDIELREQLASEVRQIFKRENMTAILVTHDQYEAFTMTDKIGVMSPGYLHQWGTGYELYHQPADRFVADFIGQGVLIPGTMQNDHSINTDLGTIDANILTPIPAKTTEVDLLLRPDDVVPDANSTLKAKIIDKAFRGADFLYTLAYNDKIKLLCLAPSHHNHAIGDTLGIRLALNHLVLFDRHKNATAELSAS